MRSVGLRREDDRRVSNSGGAGQPRSDDAEVDRPRGAIKLAEASTSSRGTQHLRAASEARAATQSRRCRREQRRRSRTCRGAGVRVVGVCLRAARAAWNRGAASFSAAFLDRIKCVPFSPPWPLSQNVNLQRVLMATCTVPNAVSLKCSL